MRPALISFVMLAGSLTISAQTTGAPHGWSLTGSMPQNYRTGVDTNGAAFLAARDSLPAVDTDKFGTLTQYISAQNYAGHRVRFRATVRSEGVTNWAGLWMRADKGEKAVAFDNMQTRAIKGTTAWQTYDVVLDIPVDATGISFGTLVAGPGEVWLDHLSFEIVSNDVPTTDMMSARHSQPLAPVNLDFRH